MSIQPLLQDTEKDWCNVRVHTLKLDLIDPDDYNGGEGTIIFDKTLNIPVYKGQSGTWYNFNGTTGSVQPKSYLTAKLGDPVVISPGGGITGTRLNTFSTLLSNGDISIANNRDIVFARDMVAEINFQLWWQFEGTTGISGTANLTINKDGEVIQRYRQTIIDCSKYTNDTWSIFTAVQATAGSVYTINMSFDQGAVDLLAAGTSNPTYSMLLVREL